MSDVLSPVDSYRDVLALIESRTLRAHFQPIADLAGVQPHAHEALIRGPVGHPLQFPDALFEAARQQGCEEALEFECARCAIETWAELKLEGRLFVNVSAHTLVQVVEEHTQAGLVSKVDGMGVPPSTLVLEITEHEHVRNFEGLLKAVRELRLCGVRIALDDFGDGRSSLRLWSEMRPDYVKIDKYFAREIATHGDKLQTFRALIQIAEIFGSQLVAEGIETVAELQVIRDLGIPLAQGYFLGKPQPFPTGQLLAAAQDTLRSREVAVFPEPRRNGQRHETVERLLIHAPALSPSTTSDQLMATFSQDDTLHAVAIVDAGHPVALINRQKFMDQYAKPYHRELYGRRSCMTFANTQPLILDRHTAVEELTSVLTSHDQRYLTDGFIITSNGQYMGLGTGERMVRAVTELRIEAARHANPLTFLPGNIPISDHINRLLHKGTPFITAYCDLNNFKPFNDQYGYWRGDEMIRLAAQVITDCSNPQRDFVGHVGGDDFVVIFQSPDWLARCRQIVDSFNEKALALYDAKDRQGIEAEDRHGVKRFFPCTAMSIGVVQTTASDYHDADDVANAAAGAKRIAKAEHKGIYVLIKTSTEDDKMSA